MNSASGFFKWWGTSGGPVPVNAFLAATGITDPTEVAAVEYLYTSLVNESFYQKFQVFYPMVGGTALTTMYNFKDPRDADDAYRITWAGGLTFSSTGVTPNGTTGYGNTHFQPNLLGQNNFCLGTYSRTDIASTPSRQSQCAIGALSGGNGSWVYSGAAYGSNQSFSGLTSIALTSLGHFASSRMDSSNLITVSEGATGSSAYASTAPVSADVNIFRLGGFAGDYDVKECAFAYISEGLTELELMSLDTIIDTYQTMLGRNV